MGWGFTRLPTWVVTMRSVLVSMACSCLWYDRRWSWLAWSDGLVVAGVVLPKQVCAVVVAVGGADDGVHVPGLGLVEIEEDAGVVVIFGEDDGGVDPEVAGAVIVSLPDPGEMGAAQVAADLGELRRGRAVGHPRGKRGDEPDEQVLLAGCHRVGRQASVADNPVVLPGPAEVAAIDPPGEFPRQVLGTHRGVQDRLVPLSGRQSQYQLQAHPAVLVEDLLGLELGAKERRREDHLPAEHEAADAHVVPEQLPSPGAIGRRL